MIAAVGRERTDSHHRRRAGGIDRGLRAFASWPRVGTIVEADDVVGGIARTVERDGYRFDIGGHRFFSKVAEIEKLWDEMLGEPMLVRPRMSRIYYGGKFYDYPLRATNALKNMGLIRATSCMMSYAKRADVSESQSKKL